MSEADPNATLTDFQKSLPEDLRASEELKSISDLTGLAKGYVELSKKSAGLLAVPDADAPKEKWDEFYAKIGRPAKAEEYKLDDPKLPQGMELTEGIKKDFAELKGLSFSLGHSPQQAKALMAWYESTLAAEHAEATKVAKAGLDSLKGEWGTKYDERVGVANKVALKLGGQELLDVLGASGLTLHPLVIKLFDKIAPQYLEDDTPPGSRGTNTPAETEARLAKLYPSMS